MLVFLMAKKHLAAGDMLPLTSAYEILEDTKAPSLQIPLTGYKLVAINTAPQCWLHALSAAYRHAITMPIFL